MRISLINLNRGGQGLSSAPTTVQQSTDTQHARHSTLDQKHERGLVLEHWIAVRPRDPLIRKFFAEQNIEGFEDSDQERYSSKLVLRQDTFTALLQPVVPPIGNPSKQ